jgi:hypothetical protein
MFMPGAVTMILAIFLVQYSANGVTDHPLQERSMNLLRRRIAEFSFQRT